MLIRTLIDPDAILAESNARSAVHLAHCTQFLEICKKYGLLTVPEGKDHSQLHQALSSIPVAFRKPWQLALTHIRTMYLSGENTSRQILSSVSQLEKFQANIDVACLDSSRAIRFGLRPHEWSTRLQKSGIEVSRYDCFQLAMAFSDLERLWNSEIALGTRTDIVWETRFSLLAKHSRHIAVVDRYGYTRYEQRKLKSGLASLIRRLALDGNAHTVTLYTKETKTASNSIVNNLRRDLRPFGGVQSFRIHFVLDNHFSKESHDRFMRFDSTVFELGVGLEAIEGQTTGKLCQVSVKHNPSSYITRENQLKTFSTDIVEIV